jgi:hypothetical protein
MALGIGPEFKPLYCKKKKEGAHLLGVVVSICYSIALEAEVRRSRG